MSRNQLLYIDDILESISAIESHLQGMTEAQFSERKNIQRLLGTRSSACATALFMTT